MFRLSLLLAACGSPLFAADLEIPIKPVTFQTIRPRAFVDGRGAVWFLDKSAVHNEAGKKVAVRPSEKHELILADKAGRFWFRNHSEPDKAGLVYSVGDTITDTKVAAPARADLASSYVAIHEDSAGRVFVRTLKAVYVFDAEGKWQELKLFDAPSTGFTPFAEDPKGRTWMSVAQNQPKVQGGSPGTVGAWCFDGKTWKNHTPADGFPFEQVEYVLPFAGDWFVVLEHVDHVYNAPRPKAKLWSPSRTAKQIADAKVFADLPTIYALYDGTDLAGNRYLHRPHAAHDGKTSQDKGTFRITPTGAVTKLTEAEERLIRRQTRVMRNPLVPIFAKPNDPLHVYPDTSSYDCLGMDKQGRIWFQEHYGSGSHCYWPAKEKPGDVLRLEPFETFHARGLLTTGGEAWAVHDAVKRWDGKKWIDDDPLPKFKGAQWFNRGGPPPGYYLANIRVQGGGSTGDGGLFAWRVTSKYEGTVFERFGRVPGGAGEEEPKKVDPKAPFYTFRLALNANRQWGKPDDPLAVLKAKAKGLTQSLKTDRAEPAAVAVAGDGTRLWVAFDWKLHVIEANGDTTTVQLAEPPADPKLGAGGAAGFDRGDPPAPMLMATTLLPFGENKALVSTASGSWVATFRATKVRELKLDKLAGGVPRNLQRDKAGAVWGWGSLEELLKFDGEKFTPMKNCRGPKAVTDDGVLWCYPPLTGGQRSPGAARPESLVRVCGDSVELFAWKPEEIETGFTKPPKGSAVVWPSEHGLLCVEAQTKADERPVLRRRVLTESMGWSGIGPAFVVTNSGEIVFGGHWARLFE